MNIDAYEARESEKAVLSLLICNFSKYRFLVEQLTPADFIVPENRSIAEKIWTRNVAGKSVDLVLMADAMPERTDYLVELAQFFAMGSVADQYAAQIIAARKRRELYLLGRHLMEQSADRDVDATVDDLRVRLKDFTCTPGDEELALTDVILNVHNRMYAAEKADTCKMGIPALDDLILGFQPSALYVVGARPAVGKSVFGMVAALKAALAGKKALIVNREMEKENVVTRMLAHLSGVDVGKIRRHSMPPEEEAQLMTAYAELDNLPLHIANKPYTPAQIRDTALRLYEADGLDLIVIDYLQRLGSGRRTSNRTEEVGAISRAIKDLSMDLKVPVVLLAQLNRSATNTRPNMSHLRESGDIEADADTVILLHRPDEDDISPAKMAQYRACRQTGGSYLEMIVDKNREGETALIPVMFDGRHMRYIPLQEAKR